MRNGEMMNFAENLPAYSTPVEASPPMAQALLTAMGTRCWITLKFDTVTGGATATQCAKFQPDRTTASRRSGVQGAGGRVCTGCAPLRSQGRHDMVTFHRTAPKLHSLAPPGQGDGTVKFDGDRSVRSPAGGRGSVPCVC